MFWAIVFLVAVLVVAWLGRTEPPDDDGGFHYGRDF